MENTSYNKFFHGSRTGYWKSIKRDVTKENWLVSNEFQLVEVNFDEVDDLETVMDQMLKDNGVTVKVNSGNKFRLHIVRVKNELI